MSTPAETERLVPQPKGDVRWVIKDGQLNEADLPQPSLENNRYLSTIVDGQEVAVGILALPPQEPAATGFWTKFAEKVRQKVSPKEQLPATRLRIEPSIDFDDARRGLHTPISALNPYVVMDDGTRYAIPVFVPKEWIGEWSEPKERPEGGNFYIGGNREVFRQRNNVALLVRLNGDTPLAEQRKESFLKGFPPTRNELLIGVREETGSDRPYITTIVEKRGIVHETSQGKSGPSNDKNTEVSDLEFHVVAERGTEENATLDNRGLVEVVVVRCVDDEVIEKIKEPPLNTKLDLPQTGSHDDLGMKVLTLGAPSLRSAGIPDSTLKGETRFTNTRREKVSIKSVRDVEPVARFRFALVGSGGPVTTVMSEAPDPLPQS
jgi:hypothetical protein